MKDELVFAAYGRAIHQDKMDLSVINRYPHQKSSYQEMDKRECVVRLYHVFKKYR